MLLFLNQNFIQSTDKIKKTNRIKNELKKYNNRTN